MRLWRFDMPVVVGVIVIATFLISIVAAIGGRSGLPLAAWGVLLPDAVFHGQVWRLVTWQLFELEPFGLIFSCLLIYWFGRDLCHAWGPKKFLAVYFGFTATVGILICLIGRFLWPEVYGGLFLGTWPIATALTIAWASLYPDREILFMFVMRANGKVLIALTIGGTLLWAAFGGVVAMLPTLLSELLMLLYVGQLRRWWLKMRLTRLEQQKKRYVNNVIRLDRDEARKNDDDKPRYLN